MARLLIAGMCEQVRWTARTVQLLRGDIVDIYAAGYAASLPAWEYWDDEIDSISSFDLLTQRRDSAREKIYLSPAREECWFGDTAETAEALRSAIKGHAAGTAPHWKRPRKPTLLSWTPA